MVCLKLGIFQFQKTLDLLYIQYISPQFTYFIGILTGDEFQIYGEF